MQVPLGRRFCSVLPQHKWFTPDLLVDQLAARNIQVLDRQLATDGDLGVQCSTMQA